MFNLSPETLIARIIVLIVSFTIHEFAHAFVADWLGDSTPRRAGRLTLNPVSHLDPIGSALLLISGFGWARPVPVAPYNLRGEAHSSLALVALAGPISNLLLAFIFAMALRFDLIFFAVGASEPARVLSFLFLEFVHINLALTFFNLIPIPPLDGFKVLTGGMPAPMAAQFQSLERYGFMILLFIVFALPFTLEILVWRPVFALQDLLLGTTGLWRMFWELGHFIS